VKNYTCIIIGSGIAAMQLAKHLSAEFRVMIITKSTIEASNSYRAQGGIAAAVAQNDDAALHYADTIEAGCSFHNAQEVWELVEEGPAIINQLQNEGFSFDKNNVGELLLGLEGAHSQHRILHCGGDATGKNIMEHLLSTLPKNIEIIENQFVYELLIHPITKQCIGIKSKDREGESHTYFSNNVVLAVGGIGGLFRFTSNDSTVTGDGIALAYRAGAEIIDMEFIQFHPTLLYVNGETYGLISEAVRGEGARLVNKFGTPLMEGKHPLTDLGPRHIVAQEIFSQRVAGHEVFLDISMIENFEEKFPTITALCITNGVSLREGRIPVAPGCHFLMGGVAVNPVGQTSIKGLFAIGETAATGVHGANRLASNSLLEGLHYGRKVAEHINGLKNNNISAWTTGIKFVTNQPLQLPSKKEIQEKVMAYAGIIRTESELIQLDLWLRQYVDSFGINHSLDECTEDDIQKIFMLQTAKLVTNAARLREESRGAHIREDFPIEDEWWKNIHIVHSQKGLEMRRMCNERHQIKGHG